ncbi:MAG: hypothetical protein KGI32_08780, partial [Gammaproteobacteria bacterium]|nr:hypothetical protein [Gammaproteobacteria bacterium]
FDTQIGIWPLIWTGFVQGVGMGQVFVPLTTVMFSTLPPQQRTEGTGVYNLIRNIGGSLGISIAFTLLARYTQVNHAVIGGRLTPYSQALQALPAPITLNGTYGLAALNDVVNQQAAMISFNNDFLLMSVLSVIALPLVFLMKRPIYSKPTGGPGATAENTTPARTPLPGRETAPASAQAAH